MTYPNFYLEGTCATFTQEQCVKLFKAIAAINDDTDYGQVFVSTSGWTLCPFNVFPVTPKTEGFLKATAEELIQRIDEICF